MLKPVDLTVLAWLIVEPGGTQNQVAGALGIAQSNVHRALLQLRASHLISPDQSPCTRPIRNLLVHGVRHVYPAELGAPARGVPTAHSAPMLKGMVSADGPLVWPCDLGEAMGTSILPLHPGIPYVALQNSRFHELMALIEILRAGRVREVRHAEQRLDALLLHAVPS